MKNFPEKYTKKIVSKGKYAQVQGQRGGIMLAALALFVMAGVFVLITLCLLLIIIFSLCAGAIDGMALLSAGLFAALTGIVAFGSAKAYLAAIQKAEEMNDVVPLTRVTAPYLPARDSLVRASARPPAAPETILLRAVGDVPATPPEQLVRPSDPPA